MAKKLESGDRIVFHNSRSNKENPDVCDLTFGRIYMVLIDGDGQRFVMDDARERNFACDQAGSAKWTKIVD